jgi:MIP family channel proteins
MTFRAYLVELVGTALLVFFSAAAVLASQRMLERAGPADHYPLPAINVLCIALAQGAVLAILLSVSTRLSPGCFNPAVTLALWVTKRFDLGRCLALIIVQMIGGILGGGLAVSLFDAGTVQRSFAATPHLDSFHQHARDNTLTVNLTPADWMPGSTAEVVLTFLLTLALLTTVLDARRAEWRWSPLLPGLALTAAVLVGYNLSGAALNPARWFGTAFWQRAPGLVPETVPVWRDHLPYWMGPIVGALLAAVVHAEWLRPDEEKKGSATPHAGTDPR